MKKKLVILSVLFCLLFSACSKKQDPDPAKAGASGQEEGTGQDEGGETGEQFQAQDGEEDADGSKEAPQEEDPTEDPKEDDPEEASGEDGSIDDPEEVILEEKGPEVTFLDYSEDIEDEDGVPMLSVTENCPVISIPGKEEIAERMNLVFEQQHTANQTYIAEDLEAAKADYQGLSEDERSDWTCYGYGMAYKVVHSSDTILSIECENYEWQGTPHPNTWTTAYCFDVATGQLLKLADIFVDLAGAKDIVEQHILDKITKEPYKDYLLEDYEGFTSDILTDQVFYLNEKGLVVICNPYMVTAYAGGIIEIDVPFEELKGVMEASYLPVG